MIGYVYHPNRVSDENAQGWAFEVTALTGVEELIAEKCRIPLEGNGLRNKEAAEQAVQRTADAIENAPFYQAKVRT